MKMGRASWAQRLPQGAARERLRERGQFWTPEWIAEAMVAYVLSGGARELYDPAAGTGAFFAAASRWHADVRLRGMELDASLTEYPGAHVRHGDFVLAPPRERLSAVVANPPYVRHHRIGAETKQQLQILARRVTGSAIDGRAGLHIYFLLRALERLDQGGRLAFILPADSFEGVFAPGLWRWVSQEYRLDGVITFAPEASPFPGVDTNALIVLIARERPRAQMVWARCLEAEAPGLRDWAAAPAARESESLIARMRTISEALHTGLSRPPAPDSRTQGVLGDWAAVMRGVATGANEFFFLTADQARERRLPDAVLRRAIGRTRDVRGDELTAEDLDRLDAAGRPTFLLALGADSVDALPAPVRAYLRRGERAGLPARALIASRRPWYKMETRTPPPFLFAYLGRRASRFIRNHAGAIPLTGFLCVYPKPESALQLDALWSVLNHPDTIANLARVGKSYGGGALKVEPRALERLPIPVRALRAAGLKLGAGKRQQGRLGFGAEA